MHQIKILTVCNSFLSNLSVRKIFCIVLFVSALGQASVASADCATLAIQMTAYQQNLVDDQVSATLVQSTVNRIKLTTQDLLELLALNYGYDEGFPAGSTLCIDYNQVEIQVRDASGVWLLTVENTVMPMYDGGDLVIPIQKTYNPISGKLATTQWYVGGLVFHMSPLLDFVVVGLAEAKHSGTLPTGVLKLSRKATFAGEGEILAGEAVFVGKVSVKGSMLVP